MRRWVKLAIFYTLFCTLAFLWGTTFLYVVPLASDSRFARVVSISFGVVTLLPMLAGPAVVTAIRLADWIRGRPPRPVSPDPDVCPCCGRPMPDGDAGGPAGGDLSAPPGPTAR